MSTIDVDNGQALIAEREALRQERVRVLVDEREDRLRAFLEEQPPALGMGWLRDLPDFRDYTPDQKQVNSLLAKTGVASDADQATLAATVDLRPWFSPVENQGSLGSCTANAVVGIVEYFERRAFGKHIDASRLFLYKATRDLLHWTGDTGAYLRSTMGALTLFGVPPEEYWPYRIADFDSEPSAFCYSFAQNYQAISYYRLDPPGTPSATLLNRIKANVAAQLPSVFGFTVYSSIAQAATSGKIPTPTAGERVLGGHAMVVVGYDDRLKIKNTNPGGVETTGAFLIRNSWGPGWGNGGYGALPYEYVTSHLAVDFWSLIREEWVDTDVFK